jgi:ABC-type transport system substrate-binding protein
MANPLVGGYTPEQVALRRAIALAYNAPREIELVRKGQMMPAQSVLPPLVSGYDPALKTEMGDHDPVRAKALLDLYGFVDRDGDGWRERPDGSPLRLEFTTEPPARERCRACGRRRWATSACASRSRWPAGRRTSRPAAPAS